MGWFTKDKAPSFNWSHGFIGLGFTVVGGAVAAGLNYLANTEANPGAHENSKAQAAAMRCAKSLASAQLEETKLAEVITNPETGQADRTKAEKALVKVQAQLMALEEEEVVIKAWCTASVEKREKFEFEQAAKAS